MNNKIYHFDYFYFIWLQCILVAAQRIFSLGMCNLFSCSMWNLVPCVCVCACVRACVHSVAKSCPTLLWPYGLYPSKLLCPWSFPGKNTGVGCHFFLQEICLTQGSHSRLLHCRWVLYHWATGEAHYCMLGEFYCQEWVSKLGENFVRYRLSEHVEM